MADLKLLILGRVRLETNDGECVGRLGAKAKALLAYLSAQPDGRAEREVLANLIWDACPQAEARHSLRQALLTLRTQLGDYSGSLLKSDRESLQLCLDAVEVDARQFEDAVMSCDDKAMTRASNLWRGPFCEGLDVGADPFEDWLLRERARLDELAATAFKRISRLHFSAGRYAAAVEAAQRCVTLNPFDDSTHAELIDLYAQRGWIGSARSAYRRCVDLFQRELGEVPDESVQAAMTRALERCDNRSESRSAFQRFSYGTPAAPLPSPSLPKQASVLKASLLVFSVVTAFSLTISVETIVRDEASAPTALIKESPEKVIAWVGTGFAESNRRIQTAVLSGHSEKVFKNANRPQITAGEAISRALRLDPDYAYLYPAGC